MERAEDTQTLDVVDGVADGVSAGDDEALRSLVTEHTQAVYRVAVAIVRDPALAEDVVQETFVKAWRKMDSFRGEGSLRAWILQIAHNTAVSYLRTVRDVSVDPSEMPEHEVALGTAQQATGRMAMGALADALDDLDPLSRSIVVLREIEGLAYDVIAETLDVPVSTVKTKLFRARRRLTVAMEGWS